MKAFLKEHLSIFIPLGLIPILCVLIFATLEFCFNKINLSAGEWAGFIAAILGYIGTVSLGILALYQNNKTNDLSIKVQKTEEDKLKPALCLDAEHSKIELYSQPRLQVGDNVVKGTEDYLTKAVLYKCENSIYSSKKLFMHGFIEFKFINYTKNPIMRCNISKANFTVVGEKKAVGSTTEYYSNITSTGAVNVILPGKKAIYRIALFSEDSITLHTLMMINIEMELWDMRQQKYLEKFCQIVKKDEHNGFIFDDLYLLSIEKLE